MSRHRQPDDPANTAPPGHLGGRTAAGVTVVNARNQCLVAERVETAGAAMSRLLGLLGRDCLPAGSALLIPRCRQVHTFFMRFPIDVIALNTRGEVVGVSSLKPFGISVCWRRASSILECPSGTVADCDIRIGDALVFVQSGRVK